jgi:hypothetical protein
MKVKAIHPILAILILVSSCKKTIAPQNSPIPPVSSGTVMHDTSAYPDEGDTAFERGGSNYSFYSEGTYFTDPTITNWDIPYNMRPVIGTYHLAPDTVRAQLASMYANGQRKIALNLWYNDLSRDGSDADSPVNGHVVNAKLGQLMPQQETNLNNLLDDITNTGFNEIDFRFASQGNSDPRGWTSWDEMEYLNDYTFIVNTITQVETRMKGRNLKVLYDLDMELGGLDTGEAITYSKRLWKDYIAIFGTHRTYGYSFATSPGRLTQAIKIYDEVGRRPDLYAFDIYGDEFFTYQYLLQELQAFGEAGKPIISQEVYYNDPYTFSQILQARSYLGLNVKYLMQWDLQRGTPGNVFAAKYPWAFSAYLN